MKERSNSYNSISFDESYTARDISRAQEERRKRRQIEIDENAEKREMRRIIKRRRAIVITLLIFLVIGSVAIAGKRVVNIWILQAEKAAAEEQLENLENKLGAKRDELTQVNTDEYVEQQARSELKMVRPGETLYLIKGTEADNTEPETEKEVPDAKR